MLNLIVSLDINELSPTAWVFFIILFVALGAIVLYFLIYFTVKLFKKLKKDDLKENSLLEYTSFVFDFKNKTFQYFDIKKANEIKQDKLESFFDCLDQQDKEKFVHWISDIFNNNYSNGDQQLVTLLNFRITEKDYKEVQYKKHIFVAKKLVKDTQVLYLDIFRLNNMPLNEIDVIDENMVSGDYYITYDNFLATKNNFMSTSKKGSFSNGGIFLVQLNKKFGETERGYNRAVIEAKIIDTLFATSKSGINIIFTRELSETASQIYLLISSFFNAYVFNSFVDKLTKNLKELFEISGYTERFNFKIVASRFNELPNDIDEAIKLFTHIESVIVEEEKDYIIYHKNPQNNLLTSYSYRGAVDDVYKNKLIAIQYKPILYLHTDACLIYGYIIELSVKNSYFKDYEEFKRLSTKAFRDQDRLEIECSVITNTISTKLKDQKRKIIYDVEYNSLGSTTSTLSKYKNFEKSKLVLTFNNAELVEDDNNIEEVINNINTLLTEGYRVGLKLSVKNYTLKEELYSLFNVFLFDVEGINVKASDHEFVSIRNLLEKFIKYKKPLILINCSSWQMIELFIRIGITCLASDLIAKSNEELLKIDPKVEKRLLSLEK